jgi:hypothetical protein
VSDRVWMAFHREAQAEFLRLATVLHRFTYGIRGP